MSAEGIGNFEGPTFLLTALTSTFCLHKLKACYFLHCTLALDGNCAVWNSQNTEFKRAQLEANNLVDVKTSPGPSSDPDTKTGHKTNK